MVIANGFGPCENVNVVIEKKKFTIQLFTITKLDCILYNGNFYVTKFIFDVQVNVLINVQNPLVGGALFSSQIFNNT